MLTSRFSVVGREGMNSLRPLFTHNAAIPCYARIVRTATTGVEQNNAEPITIMKRKTISATRHTLSS